MLRRLSLIAGAGVMLAAACSNPEAAPAPTCGDVALLVAASDYSSSVVCGAPVCTKGPGTSGSDLGTDPQLASTNGRAFFLARSEDTLFELDPRCGSVTARFGVAQVMRELGRPGRANPHDAAAAPDGSVFVALYNVPKIAVLKGGVLERTINLSVYDADGNPQAESIRIVDVAGASKAFVALERLDDDASLRSTRTSLMLRIDVARREVEGVFELAARNPFNPMSEQGGASFSPRRGTSTTRTRPRPGSSGSIRRARRRASSSPKTRSAAASPRSP